MSPIPLPYRPPYDWGRMMDFWRRRALRGVETVSDEEYRRTVRLPEATGWLTLRPDPSNHRAWLTLSEALAEHEEEITTRVRRQFDLDADTASIEAALRAADPELAILPGLRLPRAFDPFESAVRTVIGQQVSVVGATTIAGRLIERFGEASDAEALTHHFPTPARLARAEIGEIATLGMPGRRAETIIRLAVFTAAGGLEIFDEAAFLAIPGIGPWTVEYIRLRAIGDPDCFPAGDLGIRKALGMKSVADVTQLAEKWRPYRSYAAMQLWNIQ